VWHAGAMNRARRWLVWSGVLTIAAVVAAHGLGDVGFALSGPGLWLLVGSILFVAASATLLLWRSAGSGVASALLGLAAIGGVLMHHGDPGEPVVGLFLVVAYAPLRVPSRRALAITAAATVAFNIDQMVTLDAPAAFIFVADVGAAFFYLLGALVKAEAAQRARAEALLVELAHKHDVEREAAIVSERARIAREMHDVLAHTMSGLVLQLEGARLLARKTEVGADLEHIIDRSIEVAREGSAEARRAVAALRGEEVPGPEQIPRLVDEHRQVGGGPTQLTVEGRPRSLDSQTRLTVYRAVQEALANVRKHASGSDVGISLVWSPSRLSLTVQDDGGHEMASTGRAANGQGLAGMAARVAQVGGAFTAGWNGEGFRVSLSVPLEQGR